MMPKKVGSLTDCTSVQDGSSTKLVTKLKSFLTKIPPKTPTSRTMADTPDRLSSGKIPSAATPRYTEHSVSNANLDRNNNITRNSGNNPGSVAVRRRLPPALPATTSGYHPGKLADFPAAAERRGPPGKCDICSFRQASNQRRAPVYHRHLSSKEIRRISGCTNDRDSFFCPTCCFGTGLRFVPGKYHNMADERRLKIVVSSSTLHNFWLEGYEGDVQHLDWVTSPGASIQSLQHMWEVDYRYERKSMDLLLICGINNIIKGENSDLIMSCFEDFFAAVVAQGEKRNGKNGNTFAVATFFYPPQLCWFEKNGPLPHPNYKNHLPMMTDLNDQIMDLNQKIFTEQKDIYREENGGEAVGNRSRVPKFQTFGVRSKKLRLEWYRERNITRKLHLTDRHRSTLGRAAGSYFEKMFVPSYPKPT